MIRSIRYSLTAIAAVIFFGSFGAGSADAQGILREVLNRMDKHYKALKSLESNVSRVQANPQIGTSEDSSGSIVLVPGTGRDVALRLDWTRPRAETLSVASGKYQLYVPGIKRAYRGTTKSQQLNKSGGGVLKMMTMSEIELRANYNVKYIGQVNLGGSEVWHIQLDPKAREGFRQAELWVDSDGMPIQGRVTAHNNETDTFRFSDIKRNRKINASTFKVSVAKGTEIVNQ